MVRDRLVLIVDDDPQLVHTARLRLHAAGFQTTTAADGRQALQVASESQPDAIVLDVRMPRMDGLAALCELKRHQYTRHIPVVIVSASVVDQRRALEAGARCFVTKPYDGKKLVATVEAIVNQQMHFENRRMEHDLHPKDIAD